LAAGEWLSNRLLSSNVASDEHSGVDPTEGNMSKETCHACNGGKRCKTCGGSGNVKQLNPHPNPSDVNSKTETVRCYECRGSGNCLQCDGKGVV
jgi:hypothetical protein